MLYAVRFSGYKIDTFCQIFCDFSEVCRLGYLKPFPCKGSRSELFTNSLPRKGMETFSMHNFLLIFASLQTHCPARGWKLSKLTSSAICTNTLQTHCPARGWKPQASKFLEVPFSTLQTHCPARGWKR